MGKFDLAKVFSDVRAVLVKHSPEILTGIGIAGMVTTTVLAVRATPKAMFLLEEERQHRREEQEKGVEDAKDPEKISAGDAIKLCWKCYIPSAVTGVLAIGCLIGATAVNTKRNAALATAYALSESALKEYQEKVVETIGEKKEKGIREAIAKDRLEKDPVGAKEIVITEAGSTLCYDAISGRYFKSDKAKIDRAVNELNRRMISYGYISLNEFYDEIGLGYVQLGDELGWRTDKGLIELDYSSHVASDGTPCLVIGFAVTPKRDYASAF